MIRLLRFLVTGSWHEHKMYCLREIEQEYSRKYNYLEETIGSPAIQFYNGEKGLSGIATVKYDIPSNLLFITIGEDRIMLSVSAGKELLKALKELYE